MTAPWSSPESLDRAIAERVREVRETLGMTQQELADLTGISRAQIAAYENHRNRILASGLLRTARALGVPVADFYEGLEP